MCRIHKRDNTIQRELAADRQVEKELNQVERERWVEEELMTLKADKVS